MAVDGKEGFVEKVTEFFTQGPEDRAYEDAGGDARVPEADRTDDPQADANAFAVAEGEEVPYPDLAPEPEAADVVSEEAVVVEEAPVVDGGFPEAEDDEEYHEG